MKILAIIPARGGSKGIKKKNIKDFGGYPLIYWTIQAAKSSKYIHKTIISSDDPEIIKTAKKFGCKAPFIRDAKLAQDSSLAIDVTLDVINRVPGYDWIMLLQPTSPLRSEIDIDKAVETCIEFNSTSCVSISPVSEKPDWFFTLGNNQNIKSLLKNPRFVRRQELSDYYKLNGAIYLSNVETLKKYRSFVNHETVGYVMPKNRSIDIDDERDFDQALSYFRSIK